MFKQRLILISLRCIVIYFLVRQAKNNYFSLHSGPCISIVSSCYIINITCWQFTLTTLFSEDVYALTRHMYTNIQQPLIQRWHILFQRWHYLIPLNLFVNWLFISTLQGYPLLLNVIFHKEYFSHLVFGSHLK